MTKITHTFVSTKADGADATELQPSNWGSTSTVGDTHVGDALPPQWSDGGNGNVTAAVDDPTKVPITIDGSFDGGLDLDPDKADFDHAIQVTVDDVSALTGNGYILRVVDTAGGRETFDLDSWGSILMQPPVAGGGGLQVAAGDSTVIFLLSAGPDAPSSFMSSSGMPISFDRLSIAQRLLASGLFILDITAPPADGDLGAGQLGLWFDDTNGASALKVKGKSADGTVVTATIPLT